MEDLLQEIIDQIKELGDGTRGFCNGELSTLQFKINTYFDRSEVNVEAGVIKPCPFCGSKKIRVWMNSDVYWNIQCDDNDAVCAAMLYDLESKEMAIEHWNKRVL